MGELAAREGVPLRAHVEQFATHRSVPVALAAGAALGRPPRAACTRTTSPPLAARGVRRRCFCRAPSCWAPRPRAPGRALADAGAICVLATDCNPGTSPVTLLPLIMGLAVRRYGWSAKEALLAITLNAAWVLGLSGDTGSLEVGKRADLLVLDGPIEHVPYRFGRNPVPLGGGSACCRRESSRVMTAADLERTPRGPGADRARRDADGTTRLAWTEED